MSPAIGIHVCERCGAVYSTIGAYLDCRESHEDNTTFAICRVCGGLIGWIDCPTGGWWAHDVHPADDHDADP